MFPRAGIVADGAAEATFFGGALAFGLLSTSEAFKIGAPVCFGADLRFLDPVFFVTSLTDFLADFFGADFFAVFFVGFPVLFVRLLFAVRFFLAALVA